MSIHLHIERLVIDDVAIESGQENNLKAAVETALIQELLSQGMGVIPQLATSSRLVNAGSIVIESSSGAKDLGHQIGGAVFRGIKK